MGFLIGLLIALLNRDKEKNQKDIDQRKRDRFAEEVNRLAQEIAEEEERLYISEILSGGKFAPFALYLRPFALEIMFRQREKQISLLHILLPHLLLTYLLVTEIVNFDLVLQTYFDPLGLTLISVGSPNALEGAGHVIVADSSWRERFRQLAERATTIIVIPGLQEGILSEIRWLRVTGLLVYAVFFKPAGYPKAEWKKMQEFYEEEEDIRAT